jgi:hypothetical protein
VNDPLTARAATEWRADRDAILAREAKTLHAKKADEVFVWTPAESPKPAPAQIEFRSIAKFCAEYIPLAYIIEAIVRSGSIYTLTARTGAGKTAFNVIASLAVATGRPDLLGREVTRGRVAYLACENPDDIRMRFKIAAYLLNIDLDELLESILIFDRRAKPEDIHAELARLAKEEPFALIIVDTLAAFFDGKNINDAVEGGEFLRRLRPLTQIAGLPAVVVAAHPVKNAGEDNLVPYGSGAILNEVDGNLTLWKEKDTGSISLHWLAKLRGLEFDSIPFRIELAGSPDILDAKGREVQLPTLRPASEQFAEERARVENETARALLRQLHDNPGGSQQDWANAIGCSKSLINRHLKGLQTGGYAANELGEWSITPKGEKASNG